MAETTARILVVDDERFFREEIGEILDEKGYQADLCEDGETALAMCEHGEFGVVVLDVRLPGMDGIEVLRALRELQPNARVIMLSASTDQELVLEALRLGACDYLAKPLHDEELALAVHRAATSYSFAAEWGRLRDRLDLLAERMEQLAGRTAEAEAEERLDVLLQGAVETAAEVLEASRTSVMLLDEGGDALRIAAMHGTNLAVGQLDPRPRGEGAAWVALQQEGPLVVNDLQGDDRFAADPDPDRYESDAFALAPLEVANRHFGVLCATDRARGQGFGPEDVSLLRLVSLQVAELMAVEQASGKRDADSETMSVDAARELADAAEIRDEAGDRDAEVARQICDALVSEVEPGRVLRAVLKSLEKQLEADPVGIYLFDSGDRTLILDASSPTQLRSERPVLPTDRGLAGVVFQTHHLVATADPSADPRFDPEVDTCADGRSGPLICVPLQFRGKAVGLCRIHLQAGAEVSARTGEILASVLSAAIRNVLLYRSLVESIEEVATVRREARG